MGSWILEYIPSIMDAFGGLPRPYLVSAVVDKFKNLPGAPAKARVDLAPSPPDEIIDFADIPCVVDAFRGVAYPYRGPEAGELCTIPGECRADIRADCNGDGQITGADDFLEELDAVSVLFNIDDDNDNGSPDWEDTGPVEGEDDLVELQLSAPSCTSFDGFVGWSLGWDVQAPLRIWWYPDKYCPQPECDSGFETEPLFNDKQYAGYYLFDRFPLPRSVWLEATAASGNDYDITFTLHGPGGERRLPVASGGDKDKVKAGNSKCTPPSEGERFFLIARQVAPATGVGAVITTRSRHPLCAEIAGSSGPESGVSGVFAAVLWIEFEGQKENERLLWANVGYSRTMEGGSINDGVYAEVKCKRLPGCFTRQIRWITAGFFGRVAPVPFGENKYTALLESALEGRWSFKLNDEEFFSFSNSLWKQRTGMKAVWETELTYEEDRMVGNPSVPERCTLSDLQIATNFDLPGAASVQEFEFKPKTPGRLEWDYNQINPTKFEVWDKFPNGHEPE